MTGAPRSPPPPGRPASTGEESWTDSEADSSCSGQPIHLWQFLKELLLKPHSYGSFIRWLNKEKGEWRWGQDGGCEAGGGSCGPARRGAGGCSRPHLCLEYHTRTLVGPAQGLCDPCLHLSPARLRLLRVPAAMCPAHSRAVQL